MCDMTKSAHKLKNDPWRADSGKSVMSKPRRPRGLARFRKREITRAFEGVPGATSVEIFPADGRIVVHTTSRTDAPSAANPWDDVHAADAKRAS
jgi:hypothetical protein